MKPILYLYGLVGPDAPSPPLELTGVGEATVETVDVDGLQAVVSRVPDEEFGEDALEGRMQELEWVGLEGSRHERVVTWFVDRTTILPARFLTLHSGFGALRESLGERIERVRERLLALEGLREWNLKVSYRSERLAESMGTVSEEVAELDRQLEDAAPGRRYLLERKREKEVRSRLGDEARRLGREVRETLDALAEDRVDLPPPRNAGELPVVVNSALLVAREREEEATERAAEAAERLEGLGLDVSFTGPWAPYRFVEADRGE